MRVILVPLSGEHHDRAALTAAYHVAQRFRSHIVGLFMRPDPVDAISVFQGIPLDMVDQVARAATTTWNDRARLARQAFDEARAAADAAFADRPTGTDTVSAHWREVSGAEDLVLAANGRLSDLIVLAGVRSAAGEIKERFATALFHTVRPVLLVPEQGMEAMPRTVAIAWSGTAEATRALCGALPLLLNAERLHVVTAVTPRTRVESGAAVAEYLAWHGLICEIHPMYPDDGVGPALLARARELETDLLVMGGYGRSRMRERIFGGVTQHVLDHHDIAVLIAH